VNQDRFVFLEDSAHGPMTADDIRRLAAHNKIDSETPVRQGENSKWIKAGSVKGLTFGTRCQSFCSMSGSCMPEYY
jgi:hypothetical protein